MTPLERLLAIEEIKAFKARYCRATDTKNWALFRSLFAPNATFEAPSANGEPIRGADAIVALVQRAIAGDASLHLAFLPDIEILDEKRARAVWGLETVLDAHPRPDGTVPRSHGYSHDVYERDSRGEWRVKSVRVESLAQR